MQSWVLLVLLAALGVTGCKRNVECHAWRTPENDLTRDDLLRIQERTGKGDDVCSVLASPRIVVSPKGVELDGTLASPVADLPTAGLRKVDTLFEALKSDRYTWKQIHPGENFAAKTDVTFPAEMSLAAGVSVLRTICSAGYPDVTIHAGPLTIGIGA